MNESSLKIRLHYLDIGQGKPVVFLHGNGSMIQDFLISGLIDKAAQRYRVLVFDRLGYGWSSRPRKKVLTPHAQATLIYNALRALKLKEVTVVGHSWGTLVAAWLARNFSRTVTGTVLLSGFYYPQVRVDVPMSLPYAIPIVEICYAIRHSRFSVVWRG